MAAALRLFASAARRVSCNLFTSSNHSRSYALASLVGAGAGAASITLAAALCEEDGSQSDILIDSASGLKHPRTLIAPPTQHTMTAIGCGTRAVTFLNYYVYSVCLYVADPQRLRASFEVAKPLAGGFLQALVAPSTELCLRISPYRKAAFSHLRDGFTRAIEQRVRRDLETGNDGIDDDTMRSRLEDIALLKRV